MSIPQESGICPGIRFARNQNSTMEVSPLKDLPINKALTIDFNWECNIPARTIRDTVMISFEEESENPTEEDLK